MGLAVPIGINALGVGKHLLYHCFVLLEIRYRCIRRGRVLVQVNTDVGIRSPVHRLVSSSIKVLTIIGIIILGVIVDLGGGPKHDLVGFRYWKNPGPFTNYLGITGPKGHFLGTCSVLSRVAFSFIGTEAVAVRSLVTTPFYPA